MNGLQQSGPFEVQPLSDILYMKKYSFLLLASFTALHMIAQVPDEQQNKRYYDINKNIDIFNSVLVNWTFSMWTALK